VSAWLKRFGLHVAAAVGATGVFVAAAAVGANQARPQTIVASVATPALVTPRQTVRPTSAAQRVAPERSLAGTIKKVLPNALDVAGVGGREWLVEPAPGALIRLNGRPARLDQLQSGDGLVILGQAQPGSGLSFVAHAITARRK
jgi:hypothetical protein